MIANCCGGSNVLHMLILHSKCSINIPTSCVWPGTCRNIWNVPNLLLAGKWQVLSTRACNVLKMFSLVSRPSHPWCLFRFLLSLFDHLLLLSQCIVWTWWQQPIVALTDHLLQLLNWHNQLCNGFLQSSYSILARLKGGLLETQKTFKVHHLIPQEKDVLQVTIDAVMHCLPLLGEDDVVFLDCVLDNIGCSQQLLSVLLGIHFNLTDLSPMGSPLSFSIVHLKETELVGYKEAYSLFSYPGFQLHYPG